MWLRDLEFDITQTHDVITHTTKTWDSIPVFQN